MESDREPDGEPTPPDREARTGGPRGEESARDPSDDADRGRTRHPDDRVELGLALLERLEHGSLPLPEAVDRIETITSDPAVTRTILDEAELRGIVDREDGIIRPKSRRYVRFDRDVITKEGEFTCRRCGSGLSTGYFLDLEAGEHGPFGSSCIRKVTGRE